MCYDKLCSKYYNSSNFPTTYFLILLVILPSMFSYLQSSLEKVLKGEENWKEEISCTLPPETPGLINFVYSVNGLLGTEAEDVLKRIVIHLMGKLRQPYSQKCMYVNRRVSITLVRGYIPKVFAFENRYPLHPEESDLFTSFSSVLNGQNLRNSRDRFHHHLNSMPSNASPETPPPLPSS